MASLTGDERASAALLFGDALTAGILGPADLDVPAVRDAVRSRPVWMALRRRLEGRRYARGGRGYRDDSLAAFAAARRAVLGDDGAGPPRVLVRVDEFPNYDSLDEPRHGIDAYGRFHEVMRTAGVPYLVAVQPAVAHDPLDPDGAGGRPLDAAELAMLARLASDGVAFALHGYDHRTRVGHAPDRSELEGRSADDLVALLDRGLERLAPHGVAPRVFVPPFNTFGHRQYRLLAERFDVVCGGPESVPRMGYHRSPLFRLGAVYQPCYQPLYGTAATVIDPLSAAIASMPGVWMAIALHWEWELADDFAALRTLLDTVAPVARPWGDFLDAVAAARD